MGGDHWAVVEAAHDTHHRCFGHDHSIISVCINYRERRIISLHISLFFVDGYTLVLRSPEEQCASFHISP